MFKLLNVPNFGVNVLDSEDVSQDRQHYLARNRCRFVPPSFNRGPTLPSIVHTCVRVWNRVPEDVKSKQYLDYLNIN